MSLKMAQKYEKTWHKLFYGLPRWKQEEVIANPNGRIAEELAHLTALMAEQTIHQKEI